MTTGGRGVSAPGGEVREPAVRMVVLAGPESPVLGRFAIRALAPAAGIAMSAGRLPKSSPSVDPNEDAAFVAVGPVGALAAVIDGHLGFDVAARVLDTLKQQAERILVAPIRNGEKVLSGLVSGAKQDSDTVRAAADSERASSGAALSLALFSEGKLWVTTVGDTVALLAASGSKTRVFARGTRFLREYSGRGRVEMVRPPRKARLLLATDGLVDYTSQQVVTSLLASTLTHEPREAAYALLDAALLGGAGDNVTVLCVDLDRIAEAVASAGVTGENGQTPARARSR